VDGKERAKIAGISMEYGHTYLGDLPSAETEMGATIAKNIEDIAASAGVPVSRLVLIDDYNRSGGGKEEYAESYSKYLESFGMKPTHIVWEGDCVVPAEILVNSLSKVRPGANLPGKYYKGDKTYVLPHGGRKIKVIEGKKYQCPLLAAVSELSQLGIVDVPCRATGELQHYAGNAAIIVLPEQYRAVEENADKIISLFDGDDHPIYRFFFSGSRPSKDDVAAWLVQTRVI